MKKLLITGIVIFVVFFTLGTLVWFVHDKSELPNEDVHKTFTKEKVEDITISGKKSDIKIVKGDALRLKYTGQEPINYSIHNSILKVSDKQKDDIAPNINPFKKTKQKIVIEVPKEKLNDINITTDVGNVEFDSIKAETVTIWNNISDIDFDKAKLDNLEVKSEASQFNFNHSLIRDANMKINQGSINGENSLVEDSILIIGTGNISLKSMMATCDMKAFAKKGSIHFSYKDKPRDTLLKLNPSDGQKIINNPHFKNEKIGSGEYTLEFYTNHGDIIID